MLNGTKIQNLVLIGFMGAGKTTVAAELSFLTGWQTYDLDAIIVQEQGRPISDIFQNEGESFFRNIETETLSRHSELIKCVISTGGGIVGRPENWSLMRQLGPVVYLRAQWDTLWERISDCNERPLVKQADNGATTRALWERRLPLYEQADIIIDTDFLSPFEVAQNILEQGHIPWKTKNS